MKTSWSLCHLSSVQRQTAAQRSPKVLNADKETNINANMANQHTLGTYLQKLIAMTNTLYSLVIYKTINGPLQHIGSAC